MNIIPDEAECLRYFYEHGEQEWIDAVNMGDVLRPVFIDALMMHLCQIGYLKCSGEPGKTHTTVCLTVDGFRALTLFQQEADYRAQKEKENRFTRKLGFISGLITEHFVGIVEFLVSLFH